ncbi:hypothetical protein EV356DRAFT_441489 [Viridothelium virens]|uniref:J domain-containing protein n=1 Tax=Viridothelium virens TaxID=1048519 RepID=A0A6A6HIC1_VIRVR|nr:hypothetical protein EV356DRAFT_441489 [Viridothelium virens]
MRLLVLVPLLLSVFVTSIAAWTKEDHEIFRLHDEVTSHEGPDTTFYSFIGVPPSVSQYDLDKAYRKKSRNLHPDKARQTFISSHSKTDKKSSGKGTTVRKPPSQREITAFNKQAQERFARLGLVASILRGPGRERYDHFLKNGFPRWRGTGYYYSRYRPGLGSVLLGLFVVAGGGAHYGAMYISWKRQRDFVERYIRHARQMAWGDASGIQGVPGVDSDAIANGGTSTPPTQQGEAGGEAMNWNRRQKRMAEKENRKATKSGKAVAKARSSGISTPQEAEVTSGPQGAKKRVVAENGKVLIVDSVGNVYLEEETEDGETHEYLLDVDEIPQPSIFDTVLFRLPVWAYDRFIGRFIGHTVAEDSGILPHSDISPEDEETKEEKAIKSAEAPNQNGEARKRKAKNRVR